MRITGLLILFVALVMTGLAIETYTYFAPIWEQKGHLHQSHIDWMNTQIPNADRLSEAELTSAIYQQKMNSPEFHTQGNRAMNSVRRFVGFHSDRRGEHKLALAITTFQSAESALSHGGSLISKMIPGLLLAAICYIVAAVLILKGGRKSVAHQMVSEVTPANVSTSQP